MVENHLNNYPIKTKIDTHPRGDEDTPTVMLENKAHGFMLGA